MALVTYTEMNNGNNQGNVLLTINHICSHFYSCDCDKRKMDVCYHTAVKEKKQK